MSLFHVYLWLRATSEAAEIFQTIEAESAAAALYVVMRRCDIPFADYAWVVPQDEAIACYEARSVCCSDVPRPADCSSEER